MRILAALAAMLAVAVLAACSGGDGDGGASPTSTAAPPPEVIVTLRTGCDRPQPERGWEALALVQVRDAGGMPVIGATVRGSIEGPAVALGEATDETVANGEALLLFAVTEPGAYTITVDSVTGTRGIAATLTEGSELSETVEIGAACAPP